MAAKSLSDAWVNSMKLMKQASVSLALILVSAAAAAVPVTQTVGSATILGTTYEVSVLGDSAGESAAQSFNDLDPSITFTTLADALAAATTLQSVFGAADFDWQPWGIAPTDGGTVNTGGRIAYQSSAQSYSYVTLVPGLTVNGIAGGPFGPFQNVSRDAPNLYTFIQFRAAATSVPEPGALGLLGLGLFAASLSRMRSRRAMRRG
jgi:hypothetical protein